MPKDVVRGFAYEYAVVNLPCLIKYFTLPYNPDAFEIAKPFSL